MNDYYSVRVNVSPCSSDITDLIASYLADAGFESFEPDECGLTGYVPVSLLSKEDSPEITNFVTRALADFPIDCKFDISCELIVGQDWNEEWEKNYFQPILIGDRCVVHSSFHADVPSAEFDIVIDPKMAFGTGHHDTTSQMVRHILDLPIAGSTVIDMGTGTGILGILAAMRGASKVTGIEIDEAAYENALENVRLNNVSMDLIHGDASSLQNLEDADYLFANINRNIILADIDRYAARLRPGGTMLLSGFYEEDVPMIENEAERYGLMPVSRLVSNRWVALRLVKSK